MPFAAITFKIKPGTADKVTEIFRDFKRASGPIVRDARGNEVARILGTALFLKDNTVVRISHYEGDLDAIIDFMGGQDGVRETESRLQEYLAEPRDTTTPEGFRRFFTSCAMPSLQQLSPPAEFLADTYANIRRAGA